MLKAASLSINTGKFHFSEGAAVPRSSCKNPRDQHGFGKNDHDPGATTLKHSKWSTPAYQDGVMILAFRPRLRRSFEAIK